MFQRLQEDIRSFLDRDPAAKSRIEVFFCYPGFHALLGYRISHWFWRNRWFFLARFISQLTRFFSGIEIHPGATIGHRLFIDHGAGVVIGETATIGDDVTIYHGVTLGGTSAKPGIRHPQVRDHVVIGSGAQILGPIEIGAYARIGSNAVVVKDVAEDATMVGVPARTVKSKKHKKDEHQAFAAYGGTDDVLDPRQILIDEMRKELKKLSKRVEELEATQDADGVTASSWVDETAKKKGEM